MHLRSTMMVSGAGDIVIATTTVGSTGVKKNGVTEQSVTPFFLTPENLLKSPFPPDTHSVSMSSG
jgi:hypothetical protein